MPTVLDLAERDSPTFEAGCAMVNLVCAGDSITGWNNFGVVGGLALPHLPRVPPAVLRAIGIGRPWRVSGIEVP